MTVFYVVYNKLQTLTGLRSHLGLISSFTLSAPCEDRETCNEVTCWLRIWSCTI